MHKTAEPDPKRTYTDAHVHGRTCVHQDRWDAPLCGKSSLKKRANGWLCWEHDQATFPLTPQTVQ